MAPLLYAGSARYYAAGRVGYPTALAEALGTALHLDGAGRLLDVGCGPGNFTLLMAPWFEQVTGVDADSDMLAEAERQATEAGIGNVDWRQAAGRGAAGRTGPIPVISFAQSFHWMDQAAVAGTALKMLQPDGACVHVHATDAPRHRD
jgi:2-polyprenyl-3-methyl-5-hydroxy-6-metoxy-1,4-benzoquinol methylase